MLSVEKTPSDPSCSCQFHQLNATSNSDDKASQADLLKTRPHHDHHLPKFSIRDYVFTSRSKDIKKNWPFSLRNLQLCSKHGVKEVLPPFQGHSAVKIQSIKRCMVETDSFERKSISNFDAKPSVPNSKEVLDSSGNAQLKNKLENACIDTSSCRSGGENDFPSTTTSVSHSEIESVPTKRPSSSSLETDTLLEASASATVEVVAAGHPTTHKTENTARPPGKKCRLIVKFFGNSDRTSIEDIASNSTAVSETMASKVCPVCKTFTSSSNTTLNAHIDQCLSAESTPKWTADSRPTRHRIKPRKTRLMVDVYATAKHCTLEELDRRNGTSWATVLSLPAQGTERLEMPAEWKRQRVSQVHPEDAGEVYIDANGTKLRILSKSNDAPAVSKEEEDFQQKSPMKGGKESKFLLSKNKKRHARKHIKYVKLAPQSRKLFSLKAGASQICEGHEEDYGVEEGGKKEKHQVQKQMKSGDSGALRRWVCSKRTGPTKKINNQVNHQTFRRKWHLPRDLLVDGDRSSLGESLMEANRIQKYANLSENLPASHGIIERVEKPFYEAHVSDKWELSSGRKRGSPLFGVKVSDNTERSRLPMKRNSQLTQDSPIIHGSRTLEVSSLNNKRADVLGGMVDDSDIPRSRSTTPPMNSHAFAPTPLRLISRKNRTSVFKSKPIRDKRRSAGKTTRLDQIGNVDEEVHRQFTLMCKDGRKEISDEISFGRNTGKEMIQDREAVSASDGEETMDLESSELAPHGDGLNEGENTDSSAGAGDDLIDKVDVLESVEDAVATANTKFKLLSDRSNSFEDYNGMLCGGEALAGPTEPSFVDGQDMYSSDEAGNCIIGQNEHMGPGLDSDIGEGNSFPEVDPIPIPGPPGSFLPSPRDMGSDDFQGNSSLTTSRVQSSQDQLDLVDGDSSDSPISVASTVSNSAAARPDISYPEALSAGGDHPGQDKMKSGFSTAGSEQLVENSAVVAQTGTGAERCYFDGEKFKVNKISIEKRSLSFKNDGQPCCCQRKERIPQDVAPNYQELQVLKRRKMASVTVPAMVKQNARLNNLDVRPEIYSHGSCSNFASEKVVSPIMMSSAGSIPVKGSPEAGVKFSGHGDCDSPSPSTPNPVLRLMGKNLMVVNKEEDASVPLGQSQPCSQNNHVITQLAISSRVSPGHIQNQDHHYFQHVVPQGPVIFSHIPYGSAAQSFDFRLSSSFRNQTNPRTPQTPTQFGSGMFPNQHVNGGFATSMEPHMNEDAYTLSSTHDRLKIRPSETSSYNMGNVVTSLARPHKSADCSASKQEIIIIDAFPESEANVSADMAKYSEGLRASQPISSGFPIPAVANFNSMHVNPFSCYQSQDHNRESPAVHNSNFPAIPSRLPNASPVRWVCTKKGSSMLQRSPFMSASPSASHASSMPYYSPSLS